MCVCVCVCVCVCARRPAISCCRVTALSLDAWRRSGVSCCPGTPAERRPAPTPGSHRPPSLSDLEHTDQITDPVTDQVTDQDWAICSNFSTSHRQSNNQRLFIHLCRCVCGVQRAASPPIPTRHFQRAIMEEPFHAKIPSLGLFWF